MLRPPIRPLWRDIALAAVLGAAAAVWTVQKHRAGAAPSTGLDVPAPATGRPPYPVTLEPEGGAEGLGRELALNVTIGLALVARRRWPLAVVLVQFGGILAFRNGADLVTLTAVLIGVYSVALYGRSMVLSLLTLLGLAVAVSMTFDETYPPLPGWAGVYALVVPIALLGVAIRAARSRAHAADERAEALRRGQQTATRLAVAQERARIARELHDVVSHHVSVMTIQAGAAGKVLDGQPELARDALTAIEASGRQTMNELRHLLGVLNPGPGDSPLHPQPGLDQLDALVDKVRRAGQPVSVRRTGAVPAGGVDLTAYRVVQEGLTNALRHAPGARTDIAIGADADLVEIEVVNDSPPAGRSAGSPGGAGTGLLGLAERLRLYGGSLEAGPRTAGGFRLLAHIPIQEPA